MASTSATDDAAQPQGRRYLAFMVHQWIDFCTEELDSLMTMHGVDPATAYDPAAVDPSSPFLVLTLPSDAVAAALCERCILTKAIYELWGQGTSYDAVLADVRAYPSERTAPFYYGEGGGEGGGDRGGGGHNGGEVNMDAPSWAMQVRLCVGGEGGGRRREGGGKRRIRREEGEHYSDTRPRAPLSRHTNQTWVDSH